MGFGWHPIYDMENSKNVFQTTNQLTVNVSLQIRHMPKKSSSIAWAAGFFQK